jgi:hypothetical protein
MNKQVATPRYLKTTSKQTHKSSLMPNARYIPEPPPKCKAEQQRESQDDFNKVKEQEFIEFNQTSPINQYD